MNIKYYIKLAYRNSIRKQRYLYRNTLILTISFVLLIAVLSINSSLKTFINDYMLNSTMHRTVMVDYAKGEMWNSNNVISLLKEYDFVIDAQKYLSPFGVNVEKESDLLDIDFDSDLALKSSYTNEMPTLLHGIEFKNNDTGVGIIPKKFYPDGSVGVEFGKENIEFLDGEDFIGKTITTTYDIYDDNQNKVYEGKYTFKVIGVYDSVENLDESNSVYIPFNDLEKIHNEYTEKFNKYSKDKINEEYETVIALVDNSKDIEKIERDFENKYNISAYKKSSIGLLEIISTVVLFVGTSISVMVFIYSIMNISLNMFNSIKKRQCEIGILKSIGYKNKNIKFLIICESIIISFISLIIALVVSKFILVISNTILLSNLSIYMQSFKLNININAVFICFVAMVFTVIGSSLKSIKYITKISPVNAMKSNY